jgi:CheY-like chemotaxis protein
VYFRKTYHPAFAPSPTLVPLQATIRSSCVHGGLVPLIQIKGLADPLGPIYVWGLDTDMMAQPTVVIVVDDNAGLLKSVARLLAHHGIDSRTFASAEALLESDSVQTATCLPLDIHLGESGIEVQRRLAASGSKWPVIFMTASDDEATRNEAMDAGCIASLRKPFAQHVLLNAISKAVA